MKIVVDDRLEDIKDLEHLLYGANYQVSFDIYGPTSSETSLSDVIQSLISKDCELSGMSPSSPKKAMSDIVNMVLYVGDSVSGPLDIESKRAKIIQLLDQIFVILNIKSADLVSEFGFKKGHPCCPIFWEFAYDIHVSGERWLFVGAGHD